MIFLFYPLFLFSALVHVPSERRSSAPFISGDGFRAAADYIYDETDRSLNPTSVQPHSSVFVKTDYLAEYFEQIHPKIPFPYVLITHNSDYGVPGSFAPYLDDEKMIAWFGQNVEMVHPKLHPIPIGVANQYWSHGNVEALNRGLQKRVPKTHLLYFNYTIQNYYVERWKIFRLFGNEPYCYRSYSKPFEAYLEDLKKAKFVLSPRGNGLDTHRLWETLYMGSFPIVKTSCLDPAYEGLPVVVVKEWEEIDEEFLLKKYEELCQISDSSEKLTLDYWVRLINSCKTSVP